MALFEGTALEERNVEGSRRLQIWFSFAAAVAFHVACQWRFTDTDRTNIVYCSMFFVAGGIVYLYRDFLAAVVEKYRCAVILSCLVLVAGYYSANDSVYCLLLLFVLFLVYSLKAIRGGHWITVLHGF